MTITDQFCGAGGSSHGVRDYLMRSNLKGVELKLALNHWQLAIDTHQTNFPDMMHDCTDVQACDPRYYPKTDILLTSPECTNHTVAKGVKQVKAQLRLFETGVIDPSAERSRATMWDVCRFAEVHNYKLIIVENVVDARKWILFDSWLLAMHALGYEHKCVYRNSMHHHPTPQSRDRMYVVFWKKGQRTPNLDFTPLANCQKCGDVNSIQSWKPGQRNWKYRTGYVYTCPSCGRQVEPYYYAALNCIDWSDLGKKIGDRPLKQYDVDFQGKFLLPLSPNTLRRVEYGRQKYGNQRLLVHNYTPGSCSPLNETTRTVTCDDHHSLFTPFIIKGEHTLRDGYCRSATEELQSQTCRQSMALVTPPFFVNLKGQSMANSGLEATRTQSQMINLGFVTPWLVEMNRTGEAKPGDHPFSTFTSGGINHAWLSYYNGKDGASAMTDAAGTVTTGERHHLISSQEPMPALEDCYFRMLKSKEVQAAMAFNSEYQILGDSKNKVKQLGNAVTPPVMADLIERGLESLN